MCGVDPVHVHARLGFGVAELLRGGQHRLVRQAFFAHLGQDVIAGAVEDAVDPGHRVTREPLAQRLDDRDAPGDGRFILERHAGRFCRRRQRAAMYRHQGLVRRHDMTLRGDRRLANGLCRPVLATDQLKDHVHVRVAGHRDWVVIPVIDVEADPAILGPALRGYRNDFDRPSATLGDQVAVLGQDLDGPRTDRPQTRNRDT